MASSSIEQVEAVAEEPQVLLGHLLLLVRDVLALAGLAHAVALDGLGEDHRGPVGLVHRRGVGRVDLRRVVPAARQRPDLVVGPVLDHGRGLRVAPEEVLADVGAVLGLEGLVLAVDGLLHELVELPGGVRGEQLVPAAPPDDLDDVPARAAEEALQLLDDLPVAADRPVEALQVAVDDEDQVVEVLAAGQRDRAERLGLVHLAVAEERPDVAVLGLGEPAAVQVLQEAGLVDRHQRAEAHRHRRELPEVRHQPRVRVRREPAPVRLLAEGVHLLLGEAALEEGARVDAGRGVPLHHHEVAAVAVRGRVPEVLEAGVVERRRGLEARDVAAELGGLLVRAQHRRDGVPADGRADPVLDRAVTRVRGLVLHRDRVDVGRRRRIGHGRAGRAGLRDQLVEQVVGALGSLHREDRLERLPPLVGPGRVLVVVVNHARSPVSARGVCGECSRGAESSSVPGTPPGRALCVNRRFEHRKVWSPTPDGSGLHR